MKNILTAVVAAAALFGSAVTASAGGDLKGDPYDHGCGPGAFSGAYFGVHGGWVKADTEHHATGGMVSTSADGNGWAIGGHSGYGWQCGRFYLGVEGDLNWVDVDTSHTIAGQTLKTSYDYFSTTRARLGIVHDTMLLYVTGGLAMASIDHRLDWPAQGFSRSHSETMWGWTIGGGVELSRGHWSLRGEVLYVDLGEERHSYTFNAPCVVCTTDIKWRDDFVVARVGISFKLHREEQPYEPLK
jgi:outer membrane immunogenic protein